MSISILNRYQIVYQNTFLPISEFWQMIKNEKGKMHYGVIGFHERTSRYLSIYGLTVSCTLLRQIKITRDLYKNTL